MDFKLAPTCLPVGRLDGKLVRNEQLGGKAGKWITKIDQAIRSRLPRFPKNRNKL